MSLLVSKVPRNLESKGKVLGFELGDLLIIFFYLAVTNLLFGGTRLKLPVVWLGTVSITAALYFLKRGKPENYLQHLFEFLRTPGTFSAAAPDSEHQPYIERSDA